MSKTERHGKPGSMTVSTDHGVYDAMPWREPDGGPANALLTVFCEGNCLAGWVTGAFGTYTAHMADHDHADGRSRQIGTAATLAGAVAKVADRDRGLES
jgi:hypothetical protein